MHSEIYGQMHTILEAERILGTVQHGSSWPLLVQAGGATWVLKARGAAQGVGALAAEVLCSELASALQLNTPKQVLIHLAPGTPKDNNNDELADLINASSGLNLGLELLPDASQFTADHVDVLDVGTKQAILWLDGLVQNADRTMSNPNMVWSNKKLWLLDFGAALPFQYSPIPITEQMPYLAGPYLDNHVFRLAGMQEGWREADLELAQHITREVLEGAVACVPTEWLLRSPQLYAAFLWKRNKFPRSFSMLPAPLPRGVSRDIPAWLRNNSAR